VRARLVLYRTIVGALVLLPLRIRTIVYYRLGGWRGLRRIGRGLTGVTRAGPSGHRFWMEIPLDRDIQYAVGVYEPAVVAHLVRTVRPGDVCIDAGSHLGYVALLLGTLVGPTGRVLALEPTPSTFAQLRANVARNHLDHVVAIEVAAADRAGRAQLAASGTALTNSLTRDVATAGEVIDVRTDTLDALAREHLAGRPVQLVKVDVEGVEEAVLAGATELLDQGARVLLEINRVTSRDGAHLLHHLHDLDLDVTLVGMRHGATVFVEASRPT
jgi:FkbM family methyltransferase